MIPMPTTGSAELMRAAAAFNTKVAAGISKLSAITDEQVQIATTPKDEVFKSDKVTLYRYRPLAKRKVATPVLIVYSLIGRYTMTDLQEDRSLIRNLLKQGLDVWVIDWGNASRADRYLTIDDYVLGYLDDCVAAMRRETEAEAVNLLGICEGGAFTLAYAALEPALVKNLVLTVTPLDFHADQAEEKLEHGFLNVWTRSLTAKDVDQMIEVWGVLPGEFMGAIFSMLTPIRSMTKYNLDLLEVVDNEAKLINYLRMEKWLADRPHHVFRLTPSGLALVEVAPGIELERDILALMDFRPIVADPKPMDERLFRAAGMRLEAMLLDRPLADRFAFDPARAILFIDFAGYRVKHMAQVEAVREQVRRLVEPLGRKVAAVIDYDGCTIDPTIAEAWFDMARDVQSRFYGQASRYTTSAFMRLKLGDALQRREMAPHVFETAAEEAARLGPTAG